MGMGHYQFYGRRGDPLLWEVGERRRFSSRSEPGLNKENCRDF